MTMTLISVHAGQMDYSRQKGLDVVFLCFRMFIGVADGKWKFSGSLFYNVPFLTWQIG